MQILRLFLRPVFAVTALIVHAYKLVALYEQGLTARGTVLACGSLPYHEIALRIVYAAIVASALTCSLDHHILAALRTLHADLFKIRLGKSALRETGAGLESSVGAILDIHRSAAELTVFP